MTQCVGAELDEGGVTCVHCGRRARFEDQWGKVVHVRGRLKGSKNTPKLKPTASPITAGAYRPPATAATRRQDCPDCDAVLQEVSAGVWRCPWTTGRRQRFVDGVVACGWPRGEKPPELVA